MDRFLTVTQSYCSKYKIIDLLSILTATDQRLPDIGLNIYIEFGELRLWFSFVSTPNFPNRAQAHGKLKYGYVTR